MKRRTFLQLLAGSSAAGWLRRLKARALEFTTLEDPVPIQIDVRRIPTASRPAPALLLPVRIETAFHSPAPGTFQLRVRLYPDQISIETHEPELTADEVRRANSYGRLAAGTDEQRQDAWRGLCKGVGVRRAAWIRRLHERGGTLSAGRAATWTRPARTRVMPDRFHVFLFDGANQIRAVAGKQIAHELAVLWDPTMQASPDEVHLFDLASRWIASYDLAEDAGMAVTIDLPALQPTSAEGYSLFAVGLKESSGYAESAALLQQLLDNHHYSRGLSFVSTGTPTNNTGTQPSGYSATEDPDEKRELETGAGDGVRNPQSDGARVAAALGINVDCFAHVADADRLDEPAVRAMHSALWPALGGYFLKSLLEGALGTQELALLREHFVSWVRARGPLPALRVGNLPYGILPVTSFAQWQPSSFDLPPRTSASAAVTAAAFFGKFAGVLMRLLAKIETAPVPRLGGSDDPDHELLKILAMQPGSRTVRVRPVVDERFISLMLAARANAITPWSIAGAAGTRPFSRLITQWVDAWEREQQRGRKVLEELRGAPAGSSPAAWIQSARLMDLFPWADGSNWNQALSSSKTTRLTQFPTWSTDTKDLDSLLLELLRAAAGLEETVQGTTGQVAREVANQLAMLEPDPARLEGLLLDVLDLHSYRLDAWLTSLAAKRLFRLRESTPRGQPPELVLGAYGWLLGLRPSPTEHKSDGYVLAPTPGHAVTAAVLRSAFLTHDSGKDNAFCLNLTSARAAAAARLIDGVRESQPLAALLGYQLERELHEKRLDLYIAPLRKLHPLVANQETPGTEDVVESVAARNVVDGLALVRAWRGRQRSHITDALIKAGGTTGQLKAAVTAIQVVIDAQDAVADVLIHEAVHHASQGAMERSSAALDALNADGRPPELEALRTRHTGRRYPQRVCVLLAPAQSTASASPRVVAEPRVAAWLASTLGPHQRIAFRAAAKSYRLDSLRVDSIDLLDSCDATGTGDTFLEQRIRYHARVDQRLAADAPVEIKLSPERADTGEPLCAALEVLRRLKSALGAAQPLPPRTLSGGDMHSIDYGLDCYVDLRDRLAAVIAMLDKVSPQLNDTNAQTRTSGLLAASRFGISDAVPSTRQDADALQQAERVLKEVARRAGRAKERLAQATMLVEAATADYPKGVRALLDGFGEVFGRAFVVLPTFAAPGTAGALGAAFADQSLLGLGASARMATWIAQVSHVRPPIRAYEDALLAANVWRTVRVTPDDEATSVDALPSGARPEWRVLQLPYAQGAQWLGLPGKAAAAPRGLSSIVVHAPAALPFDRPLAGLLLDEWDEFIPSNSATAGMALHFNQPSAEAPQCVLLAVPPVWDTTSRSWTPELLRDVLRDALRLARVRLVDSDAQFGLGALLPATFIPSDPTRPFVARAPTVTLREAREYMKAVH